MNTIPAFVQNTIIPVGLMKKKQQDLIMLRVFMP
jgi:hypothetical protein